VRVQQNAIPQFGYIKNLFAHCFAENNTIFAEKDLFGEAHHDEELTIWFTPTPTIISAFLTLKEISEPLVVANDDESSVIWFLNG